MAQHGNGEITTVVPLPSPPQPLQPLAASPARPIEPGRRQRWTFWWTAAALFLLAVAIASAIRGTIQPRFSVVAKPPSGQPLTLAALNDNAIRILAGHGGDSHIGPVNHTWVSDRFYEGGTSVAVQKGRFIARTSDPLLYETGRRGMYAYNIPLKPGCYELKLHFVEPFYGPGMEMGGGENSRLADITANGNMLVQNFDILSDAGGPQIADVRVFKDIQPGPDGFLRLGFHAKRGEPLISAIEVEPSQPHKLNPIRIVTQEKSLTDAKGQVWNPDTYYLGGQTSGPGKPVPGMPDPRLFTAERYGHFSYAIPVADGEYTVNLHFAELYWGPGNTGGGGPGQRIFNVNCNGLSLIENLDVLKMAGSSNALVKRFRGLRPNAQGKLTLDFVPVVNYASVLAIEVLDESR